MYMRFHFSECMSDVQTKQHDQQLWLIQKKLILSSAVQSLFFCSLLALNLSASRGGDFSSVVSGASRHCSAPQHEMHIKSMPLDASAKLAINKTTKDFSASASEKQTSWRCRPQKSLGTSYTSLYTGPEWQVNDIDIKFYKDIKLYALIWYS